MYSNIPLKEHSMSLLYEEYPDTAPLKIIKNATAFIAPFPPGPQEG